MNKQCPTYIVKETQRSKLNNSQHQSTEEHINKMLIISPEQGNIIQKENEQWKNKQLLLKEYEQKCLNYANEYYSFLTNQMLSRFASLEAAAQASTAYPLFKMLRGIAKKFMFNELEIIFFLHTIENQKWKFDEDPLINNFIQHFKQDFLSNSEIHNIDGYKKLLLFLVSCGYTIKCFFNESNDLDILLITEHIQSFCSADFKKFIDVWRQSSMNSTLRIAPRVINKLYFKLIRSPKDGKQDITQDYNNLVDSIIYMSPPYQSTDNKEKQKETKIEDKQLQISQIQQNQYTLQQQQQQQQSQFQQQQQKQQQQQVQTQFQTSISQNFQNNNKIQYQNFILPSILTSNIFEQSQESNEIKEEEQPPLITKSSLYLDK